MLSLCVASTGYNTTRWSRLRAVGTGRSTKKPCRLQIVKSRAEVDASIKAAVVEDPNIDETLRAPPDLPLPRNTENEKEMAATELLAKYKYDPINLPELYTKSLNVFTDVSFFNAYGKSSSLFCGAILVYRGTNLLAKKSFCG